MHIAVPLPPPEPLVHVLLTVHVPPKQVAVADPVKVARQSAASSNTSPVNHLVCCGL